MTEQTIIYVAIAAAFMVGCAALFWGWRLGRRKLTAIPIAVTMFVVVIGGVLFWYTHRPVPTDLSKPLFSGITYQREVLAGSIIVYSVRVDLDTPGIRFMVTPVDQTGSSALTARTTSQFLGEYGPQLAINGDFFDPWRDYGVWDYYPHVGDGVNVRGLTVSEGDRYTEGYARPEHYKTLYITENNNASFTPPEAPIYNAISVNLMLVLSGEALPIQSDNDYLTGKHPRTAVALDETGSTLIIIVVDGRQPNYSEGVTIPELDAIVLEHGGYDALNLDGGGSVTLAIEGQNGLPTVLNSPIHNHIPGRERPVANHLGIFAQPIGG